MALKGIRGWLLFTIFYMFLMALMLLFFDKLTGEPNHITNLLMGVLFLISAIALVFKFKWAVNLSKISFLVVLGVAIINNLVYLVKWQVVDFYNLFVAFSFYLIFTSYFNYSERVRNTYNLKKRKIGFPEIIFVNLNNKKEQFFKDWVYLFASFFFSIVGGIYNFSKFRKKRLGFAIICLLLGILGFVLAILGTLIGEI